MVSGCDNSVLSGSPRLNHPPPPPSLQNAHILTLLELPEPPIPVSEIGPIPPPPMFSSPSPTPRRFNHTLHHQNSTDMSYDGEYGGIGGGARKREWNEWLVNDFIGI